MARPKSASRARRKPASTSLSLSEAVDAFYDVDRRYIEPDKLLVAMHLACMSSIALIGFVEKLAERGLLTGKPPDREFFDAIIRSLEKLRRAFTDGEIRHLEDGLGMSRPRKWRQSAAQRRARYKHVAISEVARLLNDGEAVPSVFHHVAKNTRALPVSASQIEKWWYEHSELDREAIKRTLK